MFRGKFNNISPENKLRATACVLACVLACFAAGRAGAQAGPATAPEATSKLVVAAKAPESVKRDPQKAQEAYVAALRLMDHKDFAGAQEAFARAAAMDPKRSDYRMALVLTREHRVSELVQQAAKARMLGQPDQAQTLLAEARTIDPNNELVLEHLEAQASQAPKARSEMAPEISFKPPIELQPDPGLQDLHLRGDLRQVITKAATAYGLKVVFDDSVKTEELRFDMERTPYKQAMPILLRMAKVFAVPVDTKTLLVVKDTEENRGKYERQVEETLYIPGSDKTQMDELLNIIKNVFDVKQVVAQTESGTIAIRAPGPTVQAINYTLADMLDGGSEVMLEVKLVTVNKSLERNLGISGPTSATAFSAAAEVQSFVTANQSLITSAISSGAFVPPTGVSGIALYTEEAAFLLLSGLATDAKLTNVLSFFGNGLTLFGASIGSGATLNAALNSSNAYALDDVNVRMHDRQTTTFRVGEKYPVTTATYSSGVSSSTASALQGVTVNGVSASTLLNQYLGTANTATVPQVQYEDLGITLKTTPAVTRSGLVKLSIDLKIEALTGASLNNIPVLTSSNYVSDITVPDGSTAVMMSEVSKAEMGAISGYPGLGELPGFQETLSDTDKTTTSSELILLITPRLVRHRNNALASRVYPFHTSVPSEN